MSRKKWHKLCCELTFSLILSCLNLKHATIITLQFLYCLAIVVKSIFDLIPKISCILQKAPRPIIFLPTLSETSLFLSKLPKQTNPKFTCTCQCYIDSSELLPDMEFVKKFTPPDFQAKKFSPSISPNFNSVSGKNTKNE